MAAGHDREGILFDTRRVAVLPGAQPVLKQRHAIDGLAVDAEGMDIAVAITAPVDEIDTQLERAIGIAHELDFIDTQEVVEILDLRQGRFTDTDGAYFIGFDQAYVAEPRFESLAEGGRTHPTSGAAAKDDDLHRRGIHRSRFPVRPLPGTSSLLRCL